MLHSTATCHGRRAIVPGPSSLSSLQARALVICKQKLSQRYRRSPNYLPQTCREDAAPFLKEPRWTEQRLQYVLFREALRHPLVTSRGIPELLNHCGPNGGGAVRWVGGETRRGGGASVDMAQTAYYPIKECVKTDGHYSQGRFVCLMLYFGRLFSKVLICPGFCWD